MTDYLISWLLEYVKANKCEIRAISALNYYKTNQKSTSHKPKVI